MLNDKKEIEVYPFAFSKIEKGNRKIDIRPYYEKFHNIQIGDKIDYVDIESKKRITREISGIAVFDNFDTSIKMLSPELIGYSSRDEISVRVERMYSKEDVKKYGVCALFIEVPQIKRPIKILNGKVR